MQVSEEGNTVLLQDLLQVSENNLTVQVPVKLCRLYTVSFWTE